MKNLPFILLISLILSISFNSCKSNQQTIATTSESSPQVETQSTEPQMLATIQRTACYGKCPMYKATFMDNGEVEYIGRRFVDNVGTYSTLISEDEILEIKNTIVELDFFGLDSLYPTPISDFPTCITEATLNGKIKRVIDKRDPPKNLRLFEKFLDSLLEGKEWKKVSENSDYYKK